MLLNVRRLAKLCLDEGVALAPRPLARAGLGRARRRAGAEPALRDDLPRQLCRTLLGQDPLQLGHGPRRCRHRELALYGGSRALALSDGEGARSRHPPGHGFRPVFALRGRARAGRGAAQGVGRRPARAHRAARRPPHRVEGPAGPDRRRREAQGGRGSPTSSSCSPATRRAATAMCATSTRRSRRRACKDIVRRVGHCTDMPAAFLAASVVTVPSTEPEAFGRVGRRGAGDGRAGRRQRPRRRARDRAGAAGGGAAASGPAGACRRATPAPSPRRSSTALTLGASAREALATRARLHVERHFSLERMVEDTLDVYISLLEGGRKAVRELTCHRFLGIVRALAKSGDRRPGARWMRGAQPPLSHGKRRSKPFADP